jgi:hypothetical protein
MPSVTVHLQLAQRVLDSFRAAPRLAPFDPGDRGAVNAFRQGAFGPDLGYIPGGHRPLSDLAHCLHSGDLSRTLIRRARTPLEVGFAWGWVTHVLADTLIHPLVGCAVGELVHGSPSHFVDGDTAPVAHVRVEAGLDAVYAERNPELRTLPMRPVFGPGRIAFLVEAFRETYGAAPAAHLFLHSHLTAARRAAQGLGLAAWTARLLPTRVEPLRTGADRHRGPISWLRTVVGSRNVALGYVLPAPPSLWFLNAVRDVEENFVELFGEEVELGGEGLANVNLDTGRPDLQEQGYGGLRRALSLLEELGGRLPALPPLPAPGAPVAKVEPGLA